MLSAECFVSKSKQHAFAIVHTLREHGHQAYFAGGCVRDLLLGHEPADYDVGTDATPQRVMQIFPQAYAVGEQFGVVLVPFKTDATKEHEGEQSARTDTYVGRVVPGAMGGSGKQRCLFLPLSLRKSVEVATFRSDVSYSDGRHPDEVRFTKDPEEDVQRRDFTINGMMLDPATNVILDFVGGRNDLKAGIIRAIGDPERRFTEDKLRMLRAVRFAARFDYTIDPATMAAIQKLAPKISQVSSERVREELTRMLTEGRARQAFELLDKSGLLKEVLPEIAAMKGVEQPPQYHPEGDVFVHTVREDPERKGLLFAGTECSVYVSWDDGDHWQSLGQSLRMNLPATSIRDLVIHHDDIVVGTHGRSFWILDNITPLRQFNSEVANSQAHLYAPQLTYRVRRNNGTDTPLPPEEPAGQNPPDGAMIDYWLSPSLTKSSAMSTSVTLEVLDATGKVVRQYSSADKPEPVNPKELNVPMYWVRPARTLSAAPGMHRFVWDLTYPAPDALEHDYPISATYHDTPRYPPGAAVLPGKYTVKLTVRSSPPGGYGGAVGVWGNSQPLEIRMDPRVKTSPEDLRRHFELDQKIAAALHQDYEALQQVRGLRAQLKTLSGQAAISKPAAELEANAATIEGGEGGRYLSTPEGRSLSRLNSGLNAVVSALDTADAAPTTQQIAMVGELEKALADQLAAWSQLKSKDIPALNEQLKKAGLPLIDLQKPVPGAVDAATTTSQDRDQNEE